MIFGFQYECAHFVVLISEFGGSHCITKYWRKKKRIVQWIYENNLISSRIQYIYTEYAQYFSSKYIYLFTILTFTIGQKKNYCARKTIWKFARNKPISCLAHTFVVLFKVFMDRMDNSARNSKFVQGEWFLPTFQEINIHDVV